MNRHFLRADLAQCDSAEVPLLEHDKPRGVGNNGAITARPDATTTSGWPVGKKLEPTFFPAASEKGALSLRLRNA